jgi:Protein of unknown function (DUF2905)
MDIQRLLIVMGLVILVAGIIWPILSRIGLGRLPGDVMFQRGAAFSTGHLHPRQRCTQRTVLAVQPLTIAGASVGTNQRFRCSSRRRDGPLSFSNHLVKQHACLFEALDRYVATRT